MNEELGYFEPRPWHRDRPQRPKVWAKDPNASNYWGIMPTDEMHKWTRRLHDKGGAQRRSAHREDTMTKLVGNALRACAAALIAGLLSLSGAAAQSGDPIRIGVEPRADRRGRGAQQGHSDRAGNLARRRQRQGRDSRPPGAARHLDDQSTPANVPNIYTKLITVDKVDLLLGPYGTNFVAPAMPTIIQNKKMTISFTAIGINDKFKYDKYFSMVSVGPEGVNAFSIGFFDIAAEQNPKPQTVAILAADAEFAQSAAQGAREEIKKHGFKLVYDQSYPPSDHRLRAGDARRSRPPIPTSSTSAPIRRTTSASSAPPTRSGSRRRCSAAR